MTSISYNGKDISKPTSHGNFRSAYIVFKSGDEIEEAEANYIVDTLEGQGFRFAGWCGDPDYTYGDVLVYDKEEFEDLMDTVREIKSRKWRVLGEYGGYFGSLKEARACAREASKIDGEAGIWCTYNMVRYEEYKNGKCVRR